VRRLYSLLILVLALGLIAGCGGGDDDDDPAAGTDVNTLLDETFSGEKEINSGQVDLKLEVESQGGNVSADLKGPFQSEGDGTLPQFQLTASLTGPDLDYDLGVTSTGDEGFVSLQGTDYAVSKPVFDQFKAGYEQAQQQGGQENQSLASLGIDPRNWLTDARVAGEADVGDTETIKITGGVDVPKLLEDVNELLEQARSLGLQGSEDIPERLSAEQMQQVEQAIRDLSVEIYTGADDRILRRLVVALDLEAPEGSGLPGGGTAALRLDISLLEVNEDQEIEAPDDPRPFEELVGQAGGLGLGGAGGSGSGSGGGGGGGASQENLEEYSRCIQEAGNDTQKARECADLLTP
jgi:hypothetical protein